MRAYAGPIFHAGAAEAMPSLAVDIVKRRKHAKGFVVEPKRWIVERTIAWLGRCRRLRQGLRKPRRTRSRSSASPSIRLMHAAAGKNLRSPVNLPDGLSQIGSLLRLCTPWTGDNSSSWSRRRPMQIKHCRRNDRAPYAGSLWSLLVWQRLTQLGSTVRLRRTRHGYIFLKDCHRSGPASRRISNQSSPSEASTHDFAGCQA